MKEKCADPWDKVTEEKIKGNNEEEKEKNTVITVKIVSLPLTSTYCVLKWYLITLSIFNSLSWKVQSMSSRRIKDA